MTEEKDTIVVFEPNSVFAEDLTALNIEYVTIVGNYSRGYTILRVSSESATILALTVPNNLIGTCTPQRYQEIYNDKSITSAGLAGAING